MRESYEPRELVAFWREAKYRQGRKGQKGKRVPAFWYRGIVIGPHKGDSSAKQNNYWVTSNGQRILVSREQMRPAFGTELWPVHEHILQEIQENPREDHTGTFQKNYHPCRRRPSWMTRTLTERHV